MNTQIPKRCVLCTYCSGQCKCKQFYVTIQGILLYFIVPGKSNLKGLNQTPETSIGGKYYTDYLAIMGNLLSTPTKDWLFTSHHSLANDISKFYSIIQICLSVKNMERGIATIDKLLTRISLYKDRSALCFFQDPIYMMINNLCLTYPSSLQLLCKWLGSFAKGEVKTTLCPYCSDRIYLTHTFLEKATIKLFNIPISKVDEWYVSHDKKCCFNHFTQEKINYIFTAPDIKKLLISDDGKTGIMGYGYIFSRYNILEMSGKNKYVEIISPKGKSHCTWGKLIYTSGNYRAGYDVWIRNKIKETFHRCVIHYVPAIDRKIRKRLYMNKCIQYKCKNCKVQEYVEERFGVCKKCKLTRYCSHQCQKQHWNEHKKICLPISKLLNERKKVSDNLLSEYIFTIDVEIINNPVFLAFLPIKIKRRIKINPIFSDYLPIKIEACESI